MVESQWLLWGIVASSVVGYLALQVVKGRVMGEP